MTDSINIESQELALAILRDAKGKGILNPSVEKGLVELIGTESRAKLGKTLEAESDKLADTSDLIKKLELKAQYSEHLRTLKYYGFLSQAKKCKIKIPSFEKIVSTFKPNELEIASHFQKPVLLLIPEVPFSAMIKTLDERKIGKHTRDTRLESEIYTDSGSGSNEIEGWRAVIIDGAQEMKPYEDDFPNLKIAERIENRRELRKPGEKGMDRRKYTLFIMEMIRSGKIKKTGEGTFTLLDDDSDMSSLDMISAESEVDDKTMFSSNIHIPCASFYSGGVDFLELNYLSHDGLMFRSSVGGDVLLK